MVRILDDLRDGLVSLSMALKDLQFCFDEVGASKSRTQALDLIERVRRSTKAD